MLWCGQEIGPPVQLPPAGSGPVIYQIGLCFPEQGNASVIDAETYLFYIHTKTSNPRDGIWTPWDEIADARVCSGRTSRSSGGRSSSTTSRSR